MASTTPPDLARFAEYRETEIARRAAITKSSPSSDEFSEALTPTNSSFLAAIKRPSSPGITGLVTGAATP
jgi:hypothetical protein